MKTYVLNNRQSLQFSIGAPELVDETLADPVFEKNVAECDGLELRFVERPVTDGLGLSLACRNLRDRPVRIKRLIPLRIAANGITGCAGNDAWSVFRMARQKNDVPGFFRPAIRDEALSDALFDSSEVSAGAGISGADAAEVTEGATRRFEADPAMILRAATSDMPLMIGFVGQDRHLNAVTLETATADGAFIGLEAAAVYDNTELAPGGTIQTHELVIREGSDTGSLLSWFTERVADLYGITSCDTKRPTVFCSWYFYGRDFGEADLHENLDALKARPIPCDVILIDNGWMDRFGDWQANERFPSGMAEAARAIKEAGYIPGIWTAPFVIAPDAAILRKYPDLILRDADGEPCIFPCAEGPCRILDPTAPHAPDYLNHLFTQLEAMGFRYHKLDFVRAVLLRENARYHDPSANRASVCRRGLELIRRALAKNSILQVCGGLFEGSAGLADIVRSGSDVRGYWDAPDRRGSYLVRIKQNVLRNHYNRLFHMDPDSLQLRRRTELFRGQQEASHLSVGKFSDEEAFTIVVNQFLGGGMTGFCERLCELDEDRRRLLRHVIPQDAPPAVALDLDTTIDCPSRFLTPFENPSNGLPPWAILTLANWTDQPVDHSIRLNEACLRGSMFKPPFAVFEFRQQAFLGVFEGNDVLSVTLPAHGARVFRLTPYQRDRIHLVGTDQSLTQGMELAQWHPDGPSSVRGRLHGNWNLACTLTLLHPDKPTVPQVITISPEALDFRMP